jgi:phage-related protein
MAPEPWSIDSYQDRRGRWPVEEFVEGLTPDLRAKVLRNLRLLREEGPSLSMPLSRQLRGYGFAELRTQSGGNIVRILYMAVAGRKIVLLHGFIKKSQQTPRRELAVATSRRDEVIGRARS